MPEPNLPAVIDTHSVVTTDGESVPIQSVAVDDIASWVEQLREMRSSCDTAMAALSAEAVRRADAAGAKTQVAGGQRWVRVTGGAETPRWDPELLSEALSALAASGVLTHDAIAGVVTSETVWKVDTTAMKRLVKLPAVRDAIRHTELPGEKQPRRITTVGWLS